MKVVQDDKLADYEENLELFANQILDFAIYMLDTAGHIRSWNAGAERLYGYSAQEIIGRHFSACYMPEDRAADKPRLALEIAARNGTCQQEGLRVKKNRTSFWAAATITALKDKAGNLRGFAKLTHDITRHKTNEAKYLELFENSHDAVLLTRPADGVILKANTAACNLFGYAEQELLSKRPDDLVDLADSRFVDAWVERAASGVVATELTFVRKGGERFEARVASKLFMDEIGGQVACTSVHDITERKQAEENLRQSEERFRLLYENAPMGIVLIDENGVFTTANQEFLKMTGYAPEEIRGMTNSQTTLPEEDAVASDRLEQLLAGKRMINRNERHLVCRDGSAIWIRLTSTMMRDKQGKPQWGMGIIENIDERKQAEEALRRSEERFRLLYENAPIGIVQTDQNACIASINPKFSEIYGAPPEEIIGLSYLETALPEDRAAAAEFSKKLRTGEIATASVERRMPRKDGTTIWVRANARLMPDIQGKPRGGIALYEDITKKKQAEDALRQSEEKFRATFEHAALGVAEVTVDGRIIDANSKLVEMLGYTKDEITQMTVRDLTHPSDMENSLSSLQELAAGKTGSYVLEKRYLRKDHSFVWVNVTGSLAPIYGKPQYMVVTVEDITARKKAEEDLKRAMESSYHQATHDMLTGLANRAFFIDRLKEALAYARRDCHLVALHLLDLDRFKSINDTLGHHIGDLLLKEVAKRLSSHVRTTDLAARLGGDEFVVIQTHMMEPAAAGVLAEKLVKDLGRKYVLEQEDVQSGTSIGIAVFPNDAENPEDLIKRADLALYEAKHRGRFNYQFYRQELGAAFLEAQRMEQELVLALKENEFCLHYQPQFDLKNGHMAGIEAFLRWRHPSRGLLTAAEFLSDAEHARLMLPIGEWALQTACRQHKKWIDSGLAVPLMLNLSSIQLRDPRLLDTLKRILEETGLPASMLQLEMRESMLWDPKFSRNLLNQMKESGLRLALDDFGSEITTLPSLDRFPLDAVKPGQKLVKKLPSHQREAAILAAIVDVAHNLNIAVCADGVENDKQFAAVKKQGCDFAQGYLLSSPLDAEKMKQLIDAELAH
ncbi:bifunctional diguanylate cyclase/phosphodiesterase [Herbaspirillum sp. HC18]|nr:bifunctional diguanylate cyclase/phosphodiesterase [Herbaspirillum sp. HC18]